MGAGWYGYTPHVSSGSFRVGGEPSTLRAELAAITWLVGILDAATPVTVYTDSES